MFLKLGGAYISYLIYSMLILFIGTLGLRITINSIKEQKEKYINWRYLLGVIFSPDWVSADIGKQNAVNKAELIKKRNKFNLSLGFIMFIISLSPWFVGESLQLFILILILYRCFSRSIELIVAFGNDVLDPEKDSDLEATDRLRLAITSYIEVILNYAVLYRLLSIIKINEWLEKLITSEGVVLKGVPISLNELEAMKNIGEASLSIVVQNKLTTWEALYKSVGISTFSGIGVEGLGPISTLHLFSSFVLVVFAMASYISNVKSRKKDRSNITTEYKQIHAVEGSKAIRFGKIVLLITLIFFICFFWLGAILGKEDIFKSISEYVENRTFLELMSVLYNIVQVVTVPTLTFIGAYLIYVTIRQQNNYIKEEKLESRLYSALDFHRKNIESITFTAPDSNEAKIIEGRKGLRKIKEYLEEAEKEINIILTRKESAEETQVLKKVAFLSVYYGTRNVSFTDNIVEEVRENYQFNRALSRVSPWLEMSYTDGNLRMTYFSEQEEIDDSIDICQKLITVINFKCTSYSNEVNSYEFYGGQKGNLEIIFENLKQICKIVDKKGNNIEDIEFVRSQITSQEKTLIKYYKLTFGDEATALNICFDGGFLNS